jgi:hypothetical protein
MISILASTRGRPVAVPSAFVELISRRGLDNSIQVLVDHLHLALGAELFKNLGKVSGVILVIHLGGHFEYDELINRRVNLIAPFDLQITTFAAVLQDAASEFLDVVIGGVDRLFILHLAVLQLH